MYKGSTPPAAIGDITVSSPRYSMKPDSPWHLFCTSVPGEDGPSPGLFSSQLSRTKTWSSFCSLLFSSERGHTKTSEYYHSGSTWDKIKIDVTMGFNPVCNSYCLPFHGSRMPVFNNSLETGFNFSNISQLPQVLLAGKSPNLTP